MICIIRLCVIWKVMKVADQSLQIGWELDESRGYQINLTFEGHSNKTSVKPIMPLGPVEGHRIIC